MEIHLRHLEPNDLQALYKIYAFEQVIENTSLVPHQGSKRIDRLFESPEQIILVAEVAGQVVGHVSIYTRTKPREKHVAVLAIAVHPDHQEQGVGTRLLQEAVYQADHWLNLVRLELEVYADNEAALGLYKKFGFEIEGEKRFCSFKAGEYASLYGMARINPNFAG